jgi:hypothetical protein
MATGALEETRSSLLLSGKDAPKGSSGTDFKQDRELFISLDVSFQENCGRFV